MGKELEYKLAVPDEATLLAILNDPEVRALAEGEPDERTMRTTYYDTPDRKFLRLKWTLRQRQEGEEQVICLKTPDADPHARKEWEVPGDTMDFDAIHRLVEAGAPMELAVFFGDGTLIRVAGAEFLRRRVMLTFPDGSKAELAADLGRLLGTTETMPLCEMELELYGGEPAEMLVMVKTLAARYGLQAEPMSKFARARTLA